MVNKEPNKINNKKNDSPPTKIIIRRLPPSMTVENFLQQIEPVPKHDYLKFMKDDSMGAENTFSRAYINFINVEEIWLFKEKFDGYVFLDEKGNEYPATVEYAPYQKIPKLSPKRDTKAGTIEDDEDYKLFLANLDKDKDKKNTDHQPVPLDKWVEEIELREQELKRGFIKKTTHLIDSINKERLEKKNEAKRANARRKNNILARQQQQQASNHSSTPNTDKGGPRKKKFGEEGIGLDRKPVQTCNVSTGDNNKKDGVPFSPNNKMAADGKSNQKFGSGLTQDGHEGSGTVGHDTSNRKREPVVKERPEKKNDHNASHGSQNSPANNRDGHQNHHHSQKKGNAFNTHNKGGAVPNSKKVAATTTVDTSTLRSPIKLLQKPKAVTDGDKKVSQTAPYKKDNNQHPARTPATVPNKSEERSSPHHVPGKIDRNGSPKKTTPSHHQPSQTLRERKNEPADNRANNDRPKDKPSVAATFTFSGNTITKVVTTDRVSTMQQSNNHTTASGVGSGSQLSGGGRPLTSTGDKHDKRVHGQPVTVGSPGRPFDSVEYMKKGNPDDAVPSSKEKSNLTKNAPLSKKERQPIPIYQPGKGIIRTKERKPN